MLQALKPKAKNPRGVTIDELFIGDPQQAGPARKAPHQSWLWFSLFRRHRCRAAAGRAVHPQAPARRAPSQRAVAFVSERLNGEDGLGAIFPAMANSVLMYDVLGDARNARRSRATRSRSLLVVKTDEAYCQPCVSPVWDTALACQALLESGTPEAVAAAGRGLDWLLPRRCSTSPATGASSARALRPAAGPSNTPTRIIPISTIPPWW